MGREWINHIRKRLRKNALRCISNQMCRESAPENLEKKPLTCISNQMGRESLVGKLSRAFFRDTLQKISVKINRNKEIEKICGNLPNMAAFRG